jgi:cytochrome P450
MLRKMLEPAFKMGAMQATLPKVVRAAEERCTAWAARGTVDAELQMREIPLKVCTGEIVQNLS